MTLADDCHRCCCWLLPLLLLFLLLYNRVADHHGLSALAAAIEQRMHNVFSPPVDTMDTDDYYSSSNNNTAAAAAAYRPEATEYADDDTEEPGWRRALKPKTGTKKLGPLAQVCACTRCVNKKLCRLYACAGSLYCAVCTVCGYRCKAL
jgi:hypothetical protein